MVGVFCYLISINMLKEGKVLGYYYEDESSLPGEGQHNAFGCMNSCSLANQLEQSREGVKIFGWVRYNIAFYDAPERYASLEESTPIIEGMDIKSRIISLMIENKNNKNKKDPGAQVLKNAQKIYGISSSQTGLQTN